MDIMGIVLKVVPYVLAIGVVSTIVAKVVKFVKEIADVLLTVVDALEDNAVSKEEVAKIIEESKDVVVAVKEIFKK